ncbi:hypothetical protein TNCT_497341 [Trichonephila clavata]|uniref:Uncharacterized protein n=1 Tax=Trichonephila clavata TaxID=2740835 RepID=A0A8X6JBU1_TRICU|nr:hypothetical protein TNCT_497341 [Trichonephila clavata]
MCRLDVYCPKQMIELPLGRLRRGKRAMSREKLMVLGILFQRQTSFGEDTKDSDGYLYSDSEYDMESESLSEDDMISESLSEDDATAELEFIPGTMEQLIQSLLNSIDEEDS